MLEDIIAFIKNIASGGAMIQNMENISLEDAENIFFNINSHNYPWKKSNPWNDESIQKLDTSSLKDIFLFELRDLENKINKYLKSEMDATELLEIVKQEIQDKTYLTSMLRKTEIYLQRHKKDLTKEREKDLFVSSVKKEIRFLKKGIMTA